MRVEILGFSQVVSDNDARIRVPGAKQRLLLALLVLWENKPVEATTIQEFLWGDRLPDSGLANMQTYVWKLRQVLRQATPDGDARLLHESGTYRLDLSPKECDFHEVGLLQAQADEALAAEDFTGAYETYSRALGMWRGNPLPTAGNSPSLALVIEARRLDEKHMAVHEGRLLATLMLGRYTEAISSLYRLITEHPVRERLYYLLMCALWLNGNPAAALYAFQDIRGRLVTQLGAEPGPELQQLHQAILQGVDTALSPREALASIIPCRV